MANPYMQYKTQSINTMSGGELVTTLYDEIIKNLRLGSILYSKSDYAGAETACDKARKIVSHLITTLDYQYPISENLAKLYHFFNQQIINATVKRSGIPLDDISPLVADLRATWVEAQKQVHMKNK